MSEFHAYSHPLLGIQLRAARGLIGWSQTNLANACGLAVSTIKRMESSEGRMRGTAENVWRAQRALEEAGIVFITSNGGGPGVRLQNPIEHR